MPINCSACILTYNSGKTIRKCLESVKNFTDIVILDGGSTDETLAVAESFGARIFFQQEGGGAAKITDFTAAREKLFSLAKEDWRLWLDSDEWLSEAAAEKIKNITDGGLENKLYALERKVVIAGAVVEHAYFYPEYCNRLFNKNSGVMLKKGKKVHEDLVAGGRVVIEKLPAVIYHQWSDNYKELIEKDNHYLSLTVEGKQNFSLRKRARIAFVNILKGAKVFFKSLLIYLRHGFKNTLPVPYSWRFARYHFMYAKKILFIHGRARGKFNKTLLIAFLGGILMGAIYYLPNLYMKNQAGRVSGGVYLASLRDMDEGFAYGSRVREALDGDFHEGDPYLQEYKNMPNIWETNYAAAFFGFIMRAAGIRHVDILFSLGDFVFPFILFFISFYLFFSIIKNRLYSFFSAFTMLSFPGIFTIAVKNLFNPNFYKTLSFENFLSLFQSIFNNYLSRLFAPGFYLIFMLFFIYCLYAAASRPNRKNIFLAGIFFGLLFYLYLYYWAFAFVLLIIFCAILLAMKCEAAVRAVCKIFILGIIISIPFWIKMYYLKTFPLYADYAARTGQVVGRHIRWASRDLYILIFILAIFLIFYWVKKKQIIAPFIISLLLTYAAVLNLQLILGFNVQPDHWGSKIGIYLVSFSILVGIYLFADLFFQLRNGRFLWLILIIFIGEMAVLSQVAVSAETKYTEYVLNKDVYGAAEWMNNNSENGSVVVTPSVYMNFVIPIITHNNIYLPSACRSMAGSGEIITRFQEINSVFNVREDYLKYNLGIFPPDKFNAMIYSESYREFLFCTVENFDKKIAESKLSQEKFVDNLLIRRKSPGGKKRERLRFYFGADYLFVGPKEKLISKFDSARYNNLNLVFHNNSVNIYKIIK